MATKSLSSHSFLALVLPLMLQLGGCDRSPSDYMASAKTSIAAKDSAAALLHLKNALAKEPNNAQARLLMGELLLANGDPGAAVIEFKRARELKIDDNRVVPLIARALYEADNSRLLLDQFGATRLSSADASAQLSSSVAMAHLSMKRPEKAREVVEAALKAAPQSDAVRLTMAHVQVAEAKPVEAMSTIAALLTDFPNLEDAWAFKGVLLQRRSEPDKALEAYARALQLNPLQLEALYSTVMIHLTRNDLKAARKAHGALAKSWPRNPNTLYLDARLNHLDGKFTLARTQFATLLNLAPENVPTLIAAGLNELSLDAPIQAEAHLARAVSLSPTESSARYFLSQANLRLGRPDKATAALAPLLESADVQAGVLVIAAQAKLQQGDAIGADALFTRAAKLKSEDAGIRTALAAARVGKADQADAALLELQQIADTTNATNADFQLISARLARNEAALALKVITTLEQKTPQSAAVAELRGQALQMMNDAAGARKAFEEALQRDKVYAPALAQLTTMDVREGKADLARQRLNAVLAADSNNSQALTMLATVAVRTGGTSAEVLSLMERATKADALNQNAWMALLMRHFHAGDMQAGLLASQSANKAIPDNVQLMDLSGRIQMASGNLNQAKSTFADIIRVAPRSAAGYMGLATSLVAAGDLQAAAKVVQRLTALYPAYIDAQRMAADVAVRQRQYNDAMAIAKELQRMYPKDAAGYTLEAQVASAQGKAAAAIAALRTAVAKDNPNATPVTLHQALLRDGQVGPAKAFSEEWLKLHPKDAPFIGYLGDTELEAKNWSAALRQYAVALQIDPSLAGVLNNSAWALLQTGDPKALDFAQRAVVIQPNRPEFLDTLAQVYVSRKEYPKAIEALRQAINRATNPMPLQLSLAKVYVTSGDNASAIAELQALVDRGKTAPLYPQARKLLAELRRR